jgi:hypothetical protein
MCSWHKTLFETSAIQARLDSNSTIAFSSAFGTSCVEWSLETSPLEFCLHQAQDVLKCNIFKSNTSMTHQSTGSWPQITIRAFAMNKRQNCHRRLQARLIQLMALLCQWWSTVQVNAVVVNATSAQWPLLLQMTGACPDLLPQWEALHSQPIVISWSSQGSETNRRHYDLRTSVRDWRRQASSNYFFCFHV